jgi:hypothetical protein
MPPFTIQREALPAAEFAALKERILASPLVARSTLLGSFQASRGFAITFTLAGRPQVERRFPFLEPFLARAISTTSARPLYPLFRRPRGEPNAFYLNVLVVPGGASVGRHADVTLRAPSGVEGALPQQVTVLYVHVPAELRDGRRGGALRLYDAEAPSGEVIPEENALVRFRGSLKHEVAAVDLPADHFRASVVLEQYRLPAYGLERLPELHIRSNAGFDAYLRDRLTGP